MDGIGYERDKMEYWLFMIRLAFGNNLAKGGLFRSGSMDVGNCLNLVGIRRSVAVFFNPSVATASSSLIVYLGVRTETWDAFFSSSS